MGRYFKEYIEADDQVKLCLHIWRPDHIKNTVFYIHGIQSHAGWLFETAGRLLYSGIQTIVADRRGSGESGGGRGWIPSLAALFADYKKGFDECLRWSEGKVPIVIGQSLGGGILAGLLSKQIFPVDLDIVIFCAPALGQFRAKNVDSILGGIRLEHKNMMPYAINIPDEGYTSIPKYLEFIKHDKRILRQAPKATRSVLLQLEDSYQNFIPWQNVRSVYFCRPEYDPIINLDASIACLSKLSPCMPNIVLFPTSSHYLEFSECREQYWSFLEKMAVGS
jgi:hypothetical protein